MKNIYDFKFKVGMPVYHRRHPNRKATVIKVSRYLIRVKFPEGEKVNYNPNDLFPDTPDFAAQLEQLKQKAQVKLNEAAAHLEEAFKAWAEASVIWTGHACGHYELKSDLDVSDFESACHRNGWETSSLYC